MEQKNETISSVNDGINKEKARSNALKGVATFEELGQHLVHTIVTNLVDDEEAVKVDVMVGEQTTVFEVNVARGDLGRVIGKKGSNAQSMRKLMNSFATKHNKRAIIEIVE